MSDRRETILAALATLQTLTPEDAESFIRGQAGESSQDLQVLRARQLMHTGVKVAHLGSTWLNKHYSA